MVDISYVATHGKPGCMPEMVLELFGKGAISVVQVVIVIFVEIVANIDVWESVVIEI